MKLICLILLNICGITGSGSEMYEVLGPSDSVIAVAGEDVILPCFIKPNISVVDMRVEWFRTDLIDSVVHLYDDQEDKNTDQSQSYRGRTELNDQQLQRGNASLKLSSVQVSDQGHYKCYIQSKTGWMDDTTFNVNVEAVGSPPVITVDGFDGSGGLHLQCESEGWFPEPHLGWLDTEGTSLSSEPAETHTNADRISVKHTITVHQSEKKIHCRVKLKHHMLETQIIISSNMFNSWRTPIILLSVSVVLIIVIAAILIARKNKAYNQLKKENRQKDFACNRLEKEKRQKDLALKLFGKHTAVNVILDADSAHPNLIVSNNGKQVRIGNTQQEAVDEEEEKHYKFDKCLGVLGKEGFSSQSFYFEVQVKGQTEWCLGVTKQSATKKGFIWLSAENGYWTVGVRYGEYGAREPSFVSLSLTVNPQRVGVFVDYEKGSVSFYDVESSSCIYSYTDQTFKEKLFPFVCFGDQRSNANSAPLLILDDLLRKNECT